MKYLYYLAMEKICETISELFWFNSRTGWTKVNYFMEKATDFHCRAYFHRARKNSFKG
jgi:hypothetical protein